MENTKVIKLILYGVTCAFAVITPFFGRESKRVDKIYKYDIPIRFNGHALVAYPINPIEEKFYKNFPGIVRGFKLEGKPDHCLFIRYIEKPSRLLHPAEECYKAKGLKISRLPKKNIRIGEFADGLATWSRFLISENSAKYEILQTVISLNRDESYSEIHEWYWNVFFSSKDKGPWVAITWKRPYRE